MKTTTEAGERTSSSAATAPTIASGMVNRITNGAAAIRTARPSPGRPGRQREGEQQRADRLAQLLALAADAHVDVGANGRFATIASTSRIAVPRSMSRRLATRSPDPALVGAMDLAGPLVDDLGHRGQLRPGRRGPGSRSAGGCPPARRGRPPARAPARRSCGRGSCSKATLPRTLLTTASASGGGQAQAAARSWSKRIWISGKPCSTLDLTSA